MPPEYGRRTSVQCGTHSCGPKVSALFRATQVGGSFGPMARRKRTQAARTQIIRAPAPQVITVRAPSARTSTRKKRGRSRGKGRSGITQQTLIGSAIGGAAMGFIEKSFPNLPTVPLLGKAGTIALVAYFLGKRIPMARDVGIAAAALAGYQLARDGHVLGEVVPQVRGVAAQV